MSDYEKIYQKKHIMSVCLNVDLDAMVSQ